MQRVETLIEKLPHEIAQLKRLKFAKRSEQMNPEQASLLDDLFDTDIAAIEAELQSISCNYLPKRLQVQACLGGSADKQLPTTRTIRA